MAESIQGDMTSARDTQKSDAMVEPPTKRRRGGRRATNPDISAEERRRLRVLKNRESAMRSLAKKAEYSAHLENMEKQAAAEFKASCENLQKLVTTAIALRTALEKVPEDLQKLISKVETCINRGTTALAVEEEQEPVLQQLATEQGNQSANGEAPSGS